MLVKEWKEPQGLLQEKLVPADVKPTIHKSIRYISDNLARTLNCFQNLLCLIQIYRQTYPKPTLEIQQYIEDINLDCLMEDLPIIIDLIQIEMERIQERMVSG